MFFVDKLASVCLGDTFPYCGPLFTSISGWVPAVLASLASRASCSGVKWTSMAFNLLEKPSWCENG